MNILFKLINKFKTEPNIFRFLFERILIKIGLSKLIVIKRNGYKIYYFPTSMSRMCYQDRHNYRIKEEEFFTSYLREGDIVIDVGANIGLLTLKAASLIGKNGLVFSIEAFPQIALYLKRNILLNKYSNIEVFNTAIGNQNGLIFINDNPIDDTMNDVNTGDKGVEISICLLDDIIPPEHKINLLKVDVEGFELFVFQSASKLLQKTDCIFFEVWDENFLKYNYNSRILIEYLSLNNFLIYRFELGTLKEVELNYKPSFCEDLIAIRKSSINEVFDRLNALSNKRGNY